LLLAHYVLPLKTFVIVDVAIYSTKMIVSMPLLSPFLT